MNEEQTHLKPYDSYDTIDLEGQKVDLSNQTTTTAVGGESQVTEEEKNNSVQVKEKIKGYYDSFIAKANVYIDKVTIQPNYKYFIILLGIGAVFMILSLFTLPMLILSPTKFVLTFGVGNILILSSFIFYFGGKEFILMMVAENRRWLTLSFFLSIFFGVLFAWRKHFFISLFFAIYQMIALVMFTLSFIPGGSAGISFIKGIFISSFSSLASSIKDKFKAKESELP